MEPIGVIRADMDPPGINLQRWRALIHQHPNLAPGTPRPGFNPATREPIMLRPTPDVARIVGASGDEVGMMYWCADGANEINVVGYHPSVEPIAQAIAAVLGARFVPDD
jgi:hypothetical protein